MSYEFLASAPHAWRRQLVIKGRRQTAGHLVADMRANGWDVERAAQEFDLDVRAVREALHYVDRNEELIAAEAAEERRHLEQSIHRPKP